MACNLYFLRDLYNIYIWDQIYRDRIYRSQIKSMRFMRKQNLNDFFQFQPQPNIP